MAIADIIAEMDQAAAAQMATQPMQTPVEKTKVEPGGMNSLTNTATENMPENVPPPGQPLTGAMQPGPLTAPRKSVMGISGTDEENAPVATQIKDTVETYNKLWDQRIQTGQVTQSMGLFGYNYLRTGDPLFLEAAQKMQEALPEDMLEPEGFWQKAFAYSVEQVPQFKGMYRNAKARNEWADKLMQDVPGGKLVEDSFLAQGAKGAASFIGGMAEYPYMVMAGHTYLDMLKPDPETGESFEPEVAKAVAYGAGAVNTAIELWGTKAVTTLIPGGKTMLTEWIQKGMVKVLRDKEFKSMALKWAGKFGQSALINYTEEMSQESVNIAAREMAKYVNNQMYKTDMPPADIDFVMNQLRETSGPAFYASVGLSGAGATVGVSADILGKKMAQKRADFEKKKIQFDLSKQQQQQQELKAAKIADEQVSVPVAETETPIRSDETGRAAKTAPVSGDEIAAVKAGDITSPLSQADAENIVLTEDAATDEAVVEALPQSKRHLARMKQHIQEAKAKGTKAFTEEAVTTQEFESFRSSLKDATQEARQAMAEGNREGYETAVNKMRAIVARKKNRMAATERRGKVRKAITKTINAGAKVKKVGGRPVSKLPAQVNTFFKALKKVNDTSVKDSKDWVLRNLETMAETTEPTIENQILMDLHRVKQRYNEMSEEELVAFNDALTDFYANGKVERLAEISPVAARAYEANQNIIPEILGPEGSEQVKIAREQGLAQFEKYPEGWIQQAKQYGQVFARTAGKDWIMHWGGIMNMISQLSGVKDGKSWTRNWGETIDQENAFNASMQESANRINEMIVRAYGLPSLKKAQDFIFNNSIAPRKSYGIKLADGTDVQFSRPELRQRYMELQDPYNKESFEKMGYTKETVAAIKAALNPEDLRMINSTNKYYQMMRERVNAVYSRLYGVEIPRNQFYTPIQKENFEATENTSPFLQDLGNRTASAATASGLKARKRDVGPLAQRSDVAVLQQYTRDMEHFIAWGEKIRDMNLVLKGKDFRTAVRVRFGKKAGGQILGVIDSHLKDMAVGRAVNGVMYKALDAYRGRLVVASLAGKLAMAPKQFTSGIAYITHPDMTMADYLAGSLDFFLDPVKKSKFFDDRSAFFATRAEKIDRDLYDAAHVEPSGGKIPKLWYQFDKVASRMMLPVKFGDKAAMRPGSWALYKVLTEKKGMSPTAAMREVEIFSRDTQQSAELSQQSSLQRGGTFAKIITTYGSAVFAMERQLVEAGRGWINNRVSTKQMAKTVAVYQLAIPMLFQFVSSGFTWDDEEQLAAAALGPWSMLPIVGDGIENIIRLAVGLKKYESSSAVQAPVNDLTKAVSKLLNKGELDARDVLGSLQGITSLPLKTGHDITEGIGDISKGKTELGLRKVAGYSPYSAEQATKR
jgi:hypothetical protein